MNVLLGPFAAWRTTDRGVSYVRGDGWRVQMYRNGWEAVSPTGELLRTPMGRRATSRSRFAMMMRVDALKEVG